MLSVLQNRNEETHNLVASIFGILRVYIIPKGLIKHKEGREFKKRSETACDDMYHRAAESDCTWSSMYFCPSQMFMISTYIRSQFLPDIITTQGAETWKYFLKCKIPGL